MTFSDKHVDMFGMPQITFHYGLSEIDELTIQAAMSDMIRAAEVLGAFLPGSEPQVLARGSSLHYMGTYRMGATDRTTTPFATGIRRFGGLEIFIWEATVLSPPRRPATRR